MLIFGYIGCCVRIDNVCEESSIVWPRVRLHYIHHRMNDRPSKIEWSCTASLQNSGLRPSVLPLMPCLAPSMQTAFRVPSILTWPNGIQQQHKTRRALVTAKLADEHRQHVHRMYGFSGCVWSQVAPHPLFP